MKQKPFFTKGQPVRAAQLTGAAFRKVRHALQQLDDAKIVYDLEVDSERGQLRDSAFNQHHVFVVVNEQANRNWPQNSLGQLTASRFFISWSVCDSEAGCPFRSGSKLQFANRAGYKADKSYRSIDEAIRWIKVVCEGRKF